MKTIWGKNTFLLVFISFFLGYSLKNLFERNDISYFFSYNNEKNIDQNAGLLPENVNFKGLYNEVLHYLEAGYISSFKMCDEYVEEGLAGMIRSLNNPHTLFISHSKNNIYKDYLNGYIKGIGVYCDLVFSDEKEAIAKSLPNIKVCHVWGKSASFLLPGDIILSVDGKKVWCYENIKEILTNSKKKKHKDKFQQEPLISSFEEIFHSHISIPKTFEKLLMGDSGEVKIKALRNNKDIKEFHLKKGVVHLQPVELDKKGVLRLRFNHQMKSYLVQNKLPLDSIKSIDLRHNYFTDDEALMDCLNALLPSGKYGYVKNREQAVDVIHLKNHNLPKKYNIYIDETTQGAALALAKAIYKSGYGNIIGKKNIVLLGKTEFITLKKIFRLENGNEYIIPNKMYCWNISSKEVDR